MIFYKILEVIRKGVLKMKDRIPMYPGRVKLVPVEGQENVFDMVRADDPVEGGTPLSKATLLSDQTVEKIWGDDAPENPTVNDALYEVAGKKLYNHYLLMGFGTVTEEVSASILLHIVNDKAEPITSESLLNTYVSQIDGFGNVYSCLFGDVREGNKKYPVISSDTCFFKTGERLFLDVTYMKINANTVQIESLPYFLSFEKIYQDTVISF